MFKGMAKDTQIAKSSEDVGISLQMRYEPGRLERLMTITNFSKQEIRMLYQGFKSQCPEGQVDEDRFKQIFSQFFPQGDATKYAHYVFRSLRKASGKSKQQCLTFEDLILMLSRISRGTTHDKLSFIFKLYDQNCDDIITKQEMLTITQAIYDMLGDSTIPLVQNTSAQEHVDLIFDQIDEDHDGFISLEDLTAWLQKDEKREHNLNQFVS